MYEEQRLTTDQIVGKLRREGYDGSYSAVRKFIEPLRAHKKKQFIQTLECRVSRAQVLSFIWTGFASLNEEKQLLLKRCITVFPDLLQVGKIIQDYRNLFQTKDVSGLNVWMKKQLSNKHSPLHSHSIGMRIDISRCKKCDNITLFKWLIRGTSESFEMDQTYDVWTRKTRFAGKTNAISV